jgi:hypothetical protein
MKQWFMLGQLLSVIYVSIGIERWVWVCQFNLHEFRKDARQSTETLTT